MNLRKLFNTLLGAAALTLVPCSLMALTPLEQGETYLRENGKKPGVRTTASGLQYEVLKEGTGRSPTASDTVQVHYRGTLLNGTEFDSTYKGKEPAAIPLTRTIPGWREGLPMMKEGAKYRFVIPSKLGYGRVGAPRGGIGPDETLVFEVELVKVN